MEVVYSVFSGSPTFYFSLEDILRPLYCHSGSTFRRRHDQRKYKGSRVSAYDSALDSFTAQKGGIGVARGYQSVETFSVSYGASS
jgi:hypothetical protein